MPYPGTALYPAGTLYPGPGGESAPTVSTGSVPIPSYRTATFAGTVTPASFLDATHWKFQYGASNFDTETPITVISGTAQTAVSSYITGLPNGTITFRLVGWNGAGTTYGGTTSFVFFADASGGNIFLAGAIRETYVMPISEFATRRWFIHEAQGVQ